MLKSVRKHFVHVSTFTNILDYYVLCFLFSKILKNYFYNFLIYDRISVLLSLIITYWLLWPFSWGWTDFRDVKNLKIFPRNSSITSKDIDVGSGGAFVFRAHRDRNQDHRRMFARHAGAPRLVFFVVLCNHVGRRWRCYQSVCLSVWEQRELIWSFLSVKQKHFPKICCFFLFLLKRVLYVFRNWSSIRLTCCNHRRRRRGWGGGGWWWTQRSPVTFWRNQLPEFF